MPCFPRSCRKRKTNKKRKNKEKQALQKLEDTLKMLQQQQEDLEKEIDACIVKAREYATTNKRVAIRALQRKKYLENKLGKVDNLFISVELQKDALEDSPTTTAVVVSLKNAGDVLKKSKIILDADKVQDLMDDIAEQHSVNTEISNAIRNSIVLDITEEELLEELETLEAADVNRKLMEVPEITCFPLVHKESEEGTSEFKKAPKKENDERSLLNVESV